jgi:hypothetical protein
VTFISAPKSSRYLVTCADGHTLRMSAADLEEAGRLLLDTPGAVDVYDNEERRFICPLDIPCVEADYRRWHERQEAQHA